MEKSIIEKFENYELTIVIDNDGEIYYRLWDLAIALEYASPKKSIEWALKNNPEYFNGKIKTFPVEVELPKENRFLPEIEAIFFVTLSNRPNSKPLKYRLSQIAKEHRIMTSELADPLQSGLMISKQLVKAFERQIAQQKQINQHEQRIFYLEDKTDQLSEELFNISRKQKYTISRLIKELVENAKEIFPNITNQKLFKIFYGILNDYNQVSRYEDISREKYPESIKLINAIGKLILIKKLDLTKHITLSQIITLIKENELWE